MFVWIAVIAVIGFVGYISYDYFVTKKRQKELGRTVRIILFDKIGNDHVFKGTYQAYEKDDEELGVYLIINKIKRPISGVSSTDYFPDRDQGKCLMVVKYADDDYRVMTKMRTGEWFQKVQLPQEEYIEFEEDEEGNTIPKLDKEGNFVHKTDAEGNLFPTFKLEPYEEPIGVGQNAREAQRFNRGFAKRMQAIRGEKQNWWDKYGNYVMTAGMMIILLMAFSYMTNKHSETTIKMAEKFGEKADEAIEEIRSPLFAERMLDYMENKDKEENAPPK